MAYAVVLLLLLTACAPRVKPEGPVSEPQAVATPSATPQPAVEPVPPAPAPPAQPAEPVAAPSPSAAVPAPQEAAEPALPAPTEPEPAAAPAPPAKPPAPQPAPKPAVRAPSEPKPAAPPAPTRTTPAPPTGSKSVPPVSKTPGPPLDLDNLKQQLRDTKAIGFFSKITLKNQMDDLLDRFREYHLGKGKRTLSDLRRSYDLLIMKVLSMVQDEDQKLASNIVSSREAIWELLEDPKKFSALQV